MSTCLKHSVASALKANDTGPVCIIGLAIVALGCIAVSRPCVAVPVDWFSTFCPPRSSALICLFPSQPKTHAGPSNTAEVTQSAYHAQFGLCIQHALFVYGKTLK